MNEEHNSIWKKRWTGPRNLLLAWLGLMMVPFLIFLVMLLPMKHPIARSSGEFEFLAILELCATGLFLLRLFNPWLWWWKSFLRLLLGLACFATSQMSGQKKQSKHFENESKSIWKKSLPLPGLMMLWLVLLAASLALLVIVTPIVDQPFPMSLSSFWLLILGAVFATSFLGLWLFIGWLCCWKNFRRFLFALACLATLIALLYVEEDWRGWHAWRQFRQQWEAKGEHFDLASLAPPPVPDQQNFAMKIITVTRSGQDYDSDGKPINNSSRVTSFVINTNLDIFSQNLDIFHNQDDFANTNTVSDRAQGKFTSLETWLSYYRGLASRTHEFPIPAQRGSPADDVLQTLSKFDAVLEELRAASQLPASRFPLDYDNEFPWTIAVPHFTFLENCASLLQLRSVAELQNGQSEKALDDVRLGFQLADKVRTEPFQWLRGAMVENNILQPIWEGLAEHKWSDTQLVALEAELAKLDFCAACQSSMRGLIAYQASSTEYVRQHREILPDLLQGRYYRGGDGNGNISSLLGGFLARLIPAGWFYQEEYRDARTMVDYFLPVANVEQGVFSPDLANRGDAVIAAEFKSPSSFHMLDGLPWGGHRWRGFGNGTKKFAYAQASVDQARTAIALERYRLARGGFPESLDALAPQFIAKVPHDVIGGQPLKYRREADGQFVLYSIGWNERDDGGVPVFTKESPPKPDLGQGDWVWRYPAK